MLYRPLRCVCHRAITLALLTFASDCALGDNPPVKSRQLPAIAAPEPTSGEPVGSGRPSAGESSPKLFELIPVQPSIIPPGPGQDSTSPQSNSSARQPESGDVPYNRLESLPKDPTSASDGPILTLFEVLAAVDRFYPLLLAIEEDRVIANGDVLAAMGAFDFSIKSGAISNEIGFYEWNRSYAGFEQQLMRGGVKVFAGHRLGVGNVPTWYGNYQTNAGGEMFHGAVIPLMRDRRIDKYRGDVLKTTIHREAVEPTILKAKIEFIRLGSQAYWDWVAAGQVFSVSKTLLRIAEERDKQLAIRVKEGIVKGIERTDNQRLIVQRRAKLIAAERKLQQSTIKLSLFFRDTAGMPILAQRDRIPNSFPDAEPTDQVRRPDDIVFAVERRPEIQKIRLLREKANVELSLAQNLFLPSVNAVIAGGQDMGLPTPKRDKSEYQLEASLLVDVPLQRRKSRGDMERVRGILGQLNHEETFARDKVVSDVQDAVIGIEAAYQQIGQAREAIELARLLEKAERANLELGNSNILFVNLRETVTFDAAIAEIEALLDYFRAIADYRAALAVDVPVTPESASSYPTAESKKEP